MTATQIAGWNFFIILLVNLSKLQSITKEKLKQHKGKKF
jgi:hypothetical protein